MNANLATQRDAFTSDDARWQAVVERDSRADGCFYYSVQTTGVYCRPVCAARLALRKNVRFHDTTDAAEAAGFRACKRCRPNGDSIAERHAEAVARACRIIEQADEPPSLEALSTAVGLSTFHLHRLFKAQTGVTPRKYAATVRGNRVRETLTQSRSVTEAIYGAGYQSNSRFYEQSTDLLGMTPTTFRAQGAGESIRFAVGECWLGAILVAASEKGICAILLGDDPEALTRDLQDRFPRARLIGGDAEFERWMAEVVGFVANPSLGLNLPLDIRGTAFQQRVWDALRQVPPGSTIVYAELANRIGNPSAVRAVAGACAANPIAVAIPCHRVIRTGGSLSGYRWGVERKRELLEREQAAQ